MHGDDKKELDASRDAERTAQAAGRTRSRPAIVSYLPVRPPRSPLTLAAILSSAVGGLAMVPQLGQTSETSSGLPSGRVPMTPPQLEQRIWTRVGFQP